MTRYVFAVRRDGSPRRPESLPPLREQAVTGATPGARGSALHALAVIWPDDPGTPMLLAGRAVADPDPDIRRVAVDALVAGFPAHPGTAPLLRSLAADADPARRLAAVEKLAAAADHPETLALLSRLAADDPNARVRAAAVGALPLDDPRALALFADRITRDDDHMVADLASTRLGSAPAGDPAVAAWLGATAERETAGERTALAASRARQVRLATLRALGAGPSPATVTLVGRLIAGDRDDEVRAAAVRTLAAVHPAGPDLDAELRGIAAGDAARSVRWAAAWALAAGRAADPGTLSLLREHLTDGRHVQSAVLAAIAAADRTPANEVWLREHARSDESPQVRRAALRVVAAGWPAERATFDLLLDLAAGDRHFDVRSAALDLLLTGWAQEPSVRPWLVAQTTGSRHRDVRRGVLTALAEGWPDDPAVPALLGDRAANDPDPTVRDAASGLLG